MLKRTVFTCSALAILLASISILTAEDVVTYNEDIKPILAVKGCTFCHNYMNRYSSLMEATSFDTQPGLPIVNTAVPDSSVILWRLAGQRPNGDPLNSMPKDEDMLPAETIALFRTWIEQGAPEDTPVDVEESKTWREIKQQFKEE